MGSYAEHKKQNKILLPILHRNCITVTIRWNTNHKNLSILKSTNTIYNQGGTLNFELLFYSFTFVIFRS